MSYDLLKFGVLAYIIGGIPFGLIISKFKNIDIRKKGSGNIGATNVYRIIGWKYGVVVFLLDGVKGYLPVLLSLNYTDAPLVHVLVGLIAIIGHSLTPFAQFKGGKGAATGVGMLFALSPDIGTILVCIAFVLITVTRYVAPTTIVLSILAPVLTYYFDYPNEYTWVLGCISIFIIYRHRSNIKRLLQGKENKI